MAAQTLSMDDVINWYDELPEDIKSSAGIADVDLSTPAGLKLAKTAMEALSGGADTGKKAERKARDYRLLVLNHSTGTFSEAGTFKGSPGRRTTDPDNFSELQKAELRAKMENRAAIKAGEKVEFLTVLVEES